MPEWPTLPRREAPAATARSAGARLGPTAPLDARRPALALGVRRDRARAAQVRRPRHRRLHRERRRGPRRRAGGVAARPLGGHHRQAHRRVPARRGAAARIGRLARRAPAMLLRGLHMRAGLSAASRGARQPPDASSIGYSDTNKQARHCGIALGAAGGAEFGCSRRRATPGSRSPSSTRAAVRRRAAAAAPRSLVEAAPNGAIRGVLRLTEQGEVVNQSYGLRPIAMRTLERTFAAVALATAHAARATPPAPALR